MRDTNVRNGRENYGYSSKNAELERELRADSELRELESDSCGTLKQ